MKDLLENIVQKNIGVPHSPGIRRALQRLLISLAKHECTYCRDHRSTLLTEECEVGGDGPAFSTDLSRK